MWIKLENSYLTKKKGKRENCGFIKKRLYLSELKVTPRKTIV